MYDGDDKPARRVLKVVMVSPHTDQSPSKFFGQPDQFPACVSLGISRAEIPLSHAVGIAADSGLTGATPVGSDTAECHWASRGTNPEFRQYLGLEENNVYRWAGSLIGELAGIRLAQVHNPIARAPRMEFVTEKPSEEVAIL
jgi:hypothetical protein